MTSNPCIDEILDLVVEANRRCDELRARLIREELDDDAAVTAYAVATAPLASAARRIAELQLHAETP